MRKFFRRLLCIVTILVVLIAMFAFTGCNSTETYSEAIQQYNSSHSSSSSSSSGSSGLSASALVTVYCSVSNVKVTSNSSYTICTGTVKNISTKYTFRYVKVKGSFLSSNGTVLDTDWTYAVGSEGLDPGESTTFRMSVTKNSSIKSCKVTTYI
jgi:hypothetical protein